MRRLLMTSKKRPMIDSLMNRAERMTVEFHQPEILVPVVTRAVCFLRTLRDETGAGNSVELNLSGRVASALSRAMPGPDLRAIALRNKSGDSRLPGSNTGKNVTDAGQSPIRLRGAGFCQYRVQDRSSSCDYRMPDRRKSCPSWAGGLL